MPAYTVKFKHSRMKPDFICSVIKYAHTREAAIRLLGKYCSRSGTVIDKRGSVLTLIDHDK